MALLLLRGTTSQNLVVIREIEEILKGKIITRQQTLFLSEQVPLVG